VATPLPKPALCDYAARAFRSSGAIAFTGAGGHIKSAEFRDP